MAELRQRARLALEAEEGVAAALVIEAREELEGDALAGDAIDGLEHARVRGDGDLAHGLVAAEQERAALVGGGRGRVLGLDVGDAVAVHLFAERARGLLQADLDEAAPQQRSDCTRSGEPGSSCCKVFTAARCGCGAQEAAELEAASGVAGADAERGLEGARAVGGAAGALEAARGAAGVADRGEGLARFEVRAEEREERAGGAAEPARGEVGCGAARVVIGERRGDLLDGELGEALVPGERGEERAAAWIGGEQRLLGGSRENRRLLRAVARPQRVRRVLRPSATARLRRVSHERRAADDREIEANLPASSPARPGVKPLRRTRWSASVAAAPLPPSWADRSSAPGTSASPASSKAQRTAAPLGPLTSMKTRSPRATSRLRQRTGAETPSSSVMPSVRRTPPTRTSSGAEGALASIEKRSRPDEPLASTT